MSSTIRTSRPSITASRSLRILTTPEDFVADPYEATAMKSTSHGISSARTGRRGRRPRPSAPRSARGPCLHSRARPRPPALARALRGPRRNEDLADRVVVVRHVRLILGRSGGVRTNRRTPRSRNCPDAVGQVERRVGAVADREQLLDAAGRTGRGLTGGGVREPLHDEPGERQRQLTQPHELDLTPAGELGVDRRVEHRRLVAQHSASARTFSSAAGWICAKRRYERAAHAAPGVAGRVIGLVVAPARAHGRDSRPRSAPA